MQHPMKWLLVPLAALALVPGASAAAKFTFSIDTPSPVAAPGVTLNGVDQTSSFTMQYTVGYTGGGNTAGWNVQAAATVPTSGTKTLPALQVTGVSAAPCTGGGCSDPANSAATPVTLSGTPVRIFNAAVNTGQGTIVLTTTYLLTFPANALAATYSSTVTVTASTGP
jgi:hypothetical protein